MLSAQPSRVNDLRKKGHLNYLTLSHLQTDFDTNAATSFDSVVTKGETAQFLILLRCFQINLFYTLLFVEVCNSLPRCCQHRLLQICI